MNRTKNTFRNIYTGFINKIITLVFPFISRTIIINVLGSEYLGLNSLFTSILQVLNLTELGFSSAIVFSMYKPISKNDKKTICALLNYYKKVYRIVGLIILILGLSILPFLNLLIKGGYPANINLYVLYLIYLFNTVITYYLFAYKSALLNAMQRNDIVNNINSIVISLTYIIQILVLIIFKNYYLFALIITISNIVNNLMVASFTSKNYPDYICKGNLPKKDKKSIKKRVYGLLIQKMCSTTRNSFDSIFISALLGLNIVAIYNNYYTIVLSVTTIMSIIITSMASSVGNSIATESIEKNYNDMQKFDFMYMLISGFITICLLNLFNPFMEIWMGKNNMFDVGTVILFCIYFYCLKMGDIRYVYYEAAGLWFEGKYRALLETILNILLNYFLGKYFGVNGIIIATIISILLINFIYGSTIIFNHYFKGIPVLKYFKSHCIYFTSTFIVAIISYFICNIFHFSPFFQFLYNLAICCCVSVIYYFLYKTKKEWIDSKLFIKNYILRKMKKI